MSEEILKALMQLFAIVTKQDDGVTKNEREYVRLFLQSQLSKGQVNIYYNLYESFLNENKGLNKKEGIGVVDEEKERKREERRAKRRAKQSEISQLEVKSDLSGEELAAKKKAREERRKRREELKKLEKEKESQNQNLTSVKDSVRTLSICKKINETLSQQQKVVVLVRLFELINSDQKFTPQRMQLIDTVSDVFNFDKQEFKSIRSFITIHDLTELDLENILIVDNKLEHGYVNAKQIFSEHLDGEVLILKVSSVDLYFLKYTGQDELNLNGLILNNKRIYLFANGSTIRSPKGKPVYYSDVLSKFLSNSDISQLSFNAYNLDLIFPNGAMGLRSVNISEEHGKLIGIMGASGAGKTSLLNVLSGQLRPSNGEVKVNNINIHLEKEQITGVFGYIPQDDLLIDDLTVYQNLYYNSKLCFAHRSEEEIKVLVKDTLVKLGLWGIKDLKVGSPLKKTISGGQRKRLNIALELIREPSVLFVDEPTSGLSSRDSENVMDLLRELTLSGKLIFVVIHQPSSDIYKMFDKVFILDYGGYPVYYGNPVESLIYFKTLDHQINSEQGECELCGNVNVELIFNIIESNIVDEYGQYTGVRKVAPEEWSELYLESKKEFKRYEEQNNKPEGNLDVPSLIKQWLIFTTRDMLSKLANRQYVLINSLEAPVLALILAFIIRYIDSFKLGYVFGRNDNIPAYLFMSIIVALFMGMTVSAEEIVRDRKILKREAFLNLSKLSYFLSKMGILFTISAIQTLSFVLIGNWILDIQGMLLDTWLVLFSVSCFANMLGLNISASFNSAVTIYILIPLLLIPQLVLSGAMFSFEKLNHYVGSDDKVPYIADIMVSRWAFEAVSVNQYKDNHFMEQFYELEKEESFADFRQVYLLPELESRIKKCMEYTGVSTQEDINMLKGSLSVLRENANGFIWSKYLHYEKVNVKCLDSLASYLISLDRMTSVNQMALDSLYEYIYVEDEIVVKRLRNYVTLIKRTLIDELAMLSKDTLFDVAIDLESLEYNNLTWNKLEEVEKLRKQMKLFYTEKFVESNRRLTDKRYFLQQKDEDGYRKWRNSYYNDELARLLRKATAKKRIVEKNGRFIQQIDPIYREPLPSNIFDYRAHFYAPVKCFLGFKINTFAFNLIVIWIFSVLLFVCLVMGFFTRTLNAISTIIVKLKIKF